MNRKRKIEKECRVFNEQWTTKYFFTLVKNKAICLICQESVSVLKEYNIKRHFTTKHSEYGADLTSEARKKAADKYVQNLFRQQSVFNRQNLEQEAATIASFSIAYLIAKHNKPFSDGEFIKECLIEASKIICPDIKHKFEGISLSRRTVTRRIECINDNINQQLSSTLDSVEWYSLALDESTDQTDTAQLLIFIRACNEKFEIVEELLSMQSMKHQTTGADIFEEVQNCLLHYNLPWNKLISVTTDGAPNLTGAKTGVVRRIQDKIYETNPNHNIIPIHCIIHQQVLCKNILHMEHVTDFIVKLVNYIRSRGLNHRQFKNLLQDLDSEYKDVIYHNQVRWLSLGTVLHRVWAIKDDIILFLEMKNNKDFPQLANHNWLCDFAFTLDIMTHLNVLNTVLQGKNAYAHDMILSLNAFQMKLNLFSQHLFNEKLDHFPTMQTLKISEEKFKEYFHIVNNLKDEYSRRFGDIRKIENSLSIVRDPFSTEINNAPSDLQLDLIDLQCNPSLRELHGKEDICMFYNSLDSTKFKNLRNFAKKMLIIFGSTYICEQTFSIMNCNKNSLRTRLKDEHLQAVLKISTSNFKPNTDQMAKEMKQWHSSH